MCVHREAALLTPLFRAAGHSGVDVPVHFYASHNWHRNRLSGNIENTEVGTFIADALGLDLDAVTKALRKKRRDE